MIQSDRSRTISGDERAGTLTVLAPTHIGPENASRPFLTGYNADGFYRYPNDVVVTCKAADKLTFVTGLVIRPEVRYDRSLDDTPLPWRRISP